MKNLKIALGTVIAAVVFTVSMNAQTCTQSVSTNCGQITIEECGSISISTSTQNGVSTSQIFVNGTLVDEVTCDAPTNPTDPTTDPTDPTDPSTGGGGFDFDDFLQSLCDRFPMFCDFLSNFGGGQ